MRVPITGGASPVVLTLAAPEGASWWSPERSTALWPSSTSVFHCREQGQRSLELIFTAFDRTRGRAKNSLAELNLPPRTRWTSRRTARA